jgi:DNA-binding MarR family transcriptional regulator
MANNMFHEAEKKDDGASRTVTISTRDANAVVRVLARFIPTGTSFLERRLLEDVNEGPRPAINARSDPLAWNALVQAAQREYRIRRSRHRLFGTAMFGEPAWDLLLALFINGRAGEKLTVSRLLRFSEAPATTALRWLKYLEKEHLVERESHPRDARSAFVELSERGEQRLETYFSETLKSQT